MSTGDVWSLHWLMRHWYQSFASDDVVIIHMISIRHSRYYLIGMAPENQGYKAPASVAISGEAASGWNAMGRRTSVTFSWSNQKSRKRWLLCLVFPVPLFYHTHHESPLQKNIGPAKDPSPSHLYKLRPCPEVAYHFISLPYVITFPIWCRFSGRPARNTLLKSDTKHRFVWTEQSDRINHLVCSQPLPDFSFLFFCCASFW